MPQKIFAVIIILAFAGCRPTPNVKAPNDEATETLLRKINDRLALMETVAAYKRAQRKPIDDPEREAAMLDKLEQVAEAHHLSKDDVRSFFTAQIEASKAVQQGFFSRWDREKAAPPKETVGLPEIRQRIDAVNKELLVALSAYRQQQRTVDSGTIRQRAADLIMAEGSDDRVREIAIRPLRND